MKSICNLVFIFFLLSLVSCQNDNKYGEGVHLLFEELFDVNHYSIPLDTSTGFESDCIQYVEKEDKPELMLFYKKNNAIHIYDFEANKFIKSTKFQPEGPDGVGTNITGFRFEKNDEIYLYSYWDKKVYVVDEFGKLKEKYEINDNGSLKYPVLSPNNNRPILKKGNKLFFAGTLYKTLKKEEIGSPFVALDLEKKSHTLLGKYPEKTFEGDWDNKCETFFDYNASIGKFVVAFAISDSIIVTDLINPNKDKHYFAGSSLLPEVKPMNANYDYEASSPEEMISYVISGTYWSIKYDKYRKLYYRFGILPKSLEDFKAALPTKFFIAVLDENFQHLAEAILPESLYPPMAVITPKGLLIPNKEKYDQQDDLLSFDVLTFKKK